MNQPPVFIKILVIILVLYMLTPELAKHVSTDESSASRVMHEHQLTR